MRSTQDKFEAKIDALADDHDLEAIIDKAYANRGRISFQHTGRLDSLFSFTFDHQHGYSTFEGGDLERRWYCEHNPKPDSSRRSLEDFLAHVGSCLAIGDEGGES